MNSVSIAMATYNGQRHIQRQLESLSAQSYLPAELVVTDDSPADDTLKIVEAFAATAPFPVHVYRNDTRLGYRANFMRAASLCRSELIAFCDQDDFWYPHKIAESVKPFGDPEVLLTYHNAYTVSEDGTRIGSLANRAAKQPIVAPLSSGPWWPCALGFTEVFRRSLLELSNLWPRALNQNHEDPQLAHDQWVFFLASVFGKIAYLDEPLVAYIQHGKNTFGWRKETFSERMRRVFRERADEYGRYTKAAENRALILDVAKDNLKGAWAERASTGSEYYRKVAWLNARRETLYTSSNFSERLSALRAIVEKNGYAENWGIGHRGLAIDMSLGVFPIGSLMRSITG